MKARIYMRMAKSTRGAGFTVDARPNASNEPLYSASGEARPTAAFAIDLEVPDQIFDRAKQVLVEGVVPEDAVTVAKMVAVTDV